ncbi:MAG: chromate transporter [Clostridia bacterium]|nr:chromate transporter [Clostridia bacterium]
MKKKLILNLFLTMLKIGAFTFGGGYAMIALLQNEFVEKKKWLDEQEFLDLVAIAESTPGPIAINSSTYIGYRVAGFWGSFFATVAICIPSFIIIFLISLFFDRFLSFSFVANAFRGIQVCVVYLIFSAGLKMLKGIKKDAFSTVILILTMLCMIVFSLFSVKFSSIFYILISGAVGLFFSLVRKANEEENK